MKYYLNTITRTIHLVADTPKPRGNGFVQCGHYTTTALLKLNSQQVARMKRNPNTRVGPVKFCGRCKQLAGVE